MAQFNDLIINSNAKVLGNLYAVTQSARDNSTKVATTAYVDSMLSAIPDATTSASGLMSGTDKIKLNNLNIAYGLCGTAAATAEKAITTEANWILEPGAMIFVKFSYTNTANNPTLKVNNTEAKSVWYNTALITTSNLAYAATANRPMLFVYDGTQYVFVSWSVDSNTTYSNASLGQGYGTCTTAAETAAKVVALSSYSLVTGGIVSVKFSYDVGANATMNVNSKGAKAIYHRDAPITAGQILANDIAYFIYNGTNYILLGVDRISTDPTAISEAEIVAAFAD